MARPAHSVINLAAVRHNYRHAKRLAGAAKVVAVVKADAYGHGAVPIARTLADEADAFGVACIEEALDLREAQIENPILLLEGFFTADELDLIDHHRLSTVIHEPGQLAAFLAACPTRKIDVWLKLDTGMHRLGLPPLAFAAACTALHRCPHVGHLVAMTHFADATELAGNRTQQQLAVFKRCAAGSGLEHSMANSAAVLAWPATHGNWVRPGFMLYGLSPLDHFHPNTALLRPAMQLNSAIIAIRELPAGEPIGYGGRFVCRRATRVGVVAIGYGDGYPRHAIDGTPVAVNGQRTRLIGRVSMDTLTVDLTGMDDITPGDQVELWGDTVSANEVAAASTTIAYELLTGITRRVPRCYVAMST